MRKFVITLMSLLVTCGCAVHKTTKQSALPNPQNADYVSGVEPQLGTARYQALTHTKLAAAYIARGQFGIALQELNKALESDPHYSHAYSLLGIVEAKLGDNKKANMFFSKALSLAPDDPDLMNNYSWYLCQVGRAQEGLQYSLKSIQNPLYSTPEKALINAGLCSEKLNRIQDAINYYEKSLQTQPNNPLALYSLARLATTYGHYRQAKDYLNRLIALNYNTPEVSSLMAQVNKGLAEGSPIPPSVGVANTSAIPMTDGNM